MNCHKIRKEYHRYRKRVEEKITHILSVLSEVSLGDFNVKAEIRSKDILGALAVGINEMVGNLRRMNEEQIRKAKILERAKNNMEGPNPI